MVFIKAEKLEKRRSKLSGKGEKMYIVEVIFAMIGVVVVGVGAVTALSAGLLSLFDLIVKRTQSV